MAHFKDMLEVKKFVIDTFPLLGGKLDVIELTENKCICAISSDDEIKLSSIDFISFINHLSVLLIDLGARLLAYNNTGEATVNTENIVFLNAPQDAHIALTVEKLSSSIAPAVYNYRAIIKDAEGNDIATANLSQTVE